MSNRGAKNNGYGPMGMEKSPARKKREAAGRKRQEKYWAAKSGEVITRYTCPVCSGDHLRADCTTLGA
jgi:hypothetical protein